MEGPAILVIFPILFLLFPHLVYILVIPRGHEGKYSGWTYNYSTCKLQHDYLYQIERPGHPGHLCPPYSPHLEDQSEYLCRVYRVRSCHTIISHESCNRLTFSQTHGSMYLRRHLRPRKSPLRRKWLSQRRPRGSERPQYPRCSVSRWELLRDVSLAGWCWSERSAACAVCHSRSLIFDEVFCFAVCIRRFLMIIDRNSLGWGRRRTSSARTSLCSGVKLSGRSHICASTLGRVLWMKVCLLERHSARKCLRFLALAWVEYCNGTGNTFYANLRRKNGREQPYNVCLSSTRHRSVLTRSCRSSTGPSETKPGVPGRSSK